MKSLKTNAILNIVLNISRILFSLVTIPYASRVLAASNYGKVSFAYSIVRYFILVAGLGIAVYAQREAPAFRDDKKRIGNFSNQVFTINVVATLLAYILLFVLMVVWGKLGDYCLLIIIHSFAIILFTLGADWVNVVYEDYLYITIRSVVVLLGSIVLMFLFVKTPEDYYIYAIISVIASAGGHFLNIFYIRKYVRLKIVSLKECLVHLKPILILFCVSLTTIIYISMDITVLGIYKSDSDVGVYTMSSNIYSVVKQVISAAITVGIPRMAYYYGQDRIKEYKELAKRVVDSLISVILPTIIGLIFLSYHVLSVMGGSEYTSGQMSLIILAVALAFAIMAGFYSNGYLLIVKKDRKYLIATIISAVLNTALNFALIPWLGVVGAAITTLFAELSMTILSARDAIKEYRLLPSKRAVLSSLLGALVVGIICIAVIQTSMNSILIIIFAFIPSVIAYYLVLRLTKNPLADVVDDFFKKGLKRFIKNS